MKVTINLRDLGYTEEQREAIEEAIDDAFNVGYEEAMFQQEEESVESVSLH